MTCKIDRERACRAADRYPTDGPGRGIGRGVTGGKGRREVGLNYGSPGSLSRA